MFIAEMESRMHIVLVSNIKSSLAEIMSGYLQFYGSKDVVVSLRDVSAAIHPIAQQVLKEDGIDVWENSTSIPKNIKKLTIYINQSPPQQKAALSKSFNFEDPLTNESYDKIVDAFRKTREEIKKASIALVGEIAVGSK